MIDRIKSSIALVAFAVLTAGPSVGAGICTPQTPPGEPCYPAPEPVPYCTPQTPPGVFCVPPPPPQVIAVPTLNEWDVLLLATIIMAGAAVRLTKRRKVTPPVRGADIKETLAHGAGAYARCFYCSRYSDDRRSLTHLHFKCECGKTSGWSGGFTPPTQDAVWSNPKEEPDALYHAMLADGIITEDKVRS